MRSMVQERDDIVGLDSSIIMHPQACGKPPATSSISPIPSWTARSAGSAGALTSCTTAVSRATAAR